MPRLTSSQQGAVDDALAGRHKRAVHVMVRVRPQLISEVEDTCCVSLSEVRPH